MIRRDYAHFQGVLEELQSDVAYYGRRLAVAKKKKDILRVLDLVMNLLAQIELDTEALDRYNALAAKVRFTGTMEVV